jgi:hypothetical protein
LDFQALFIILLKDKMKKISYENRYNDVFTFTLLENGNILWEGEFKHCRFAWPNVYKDAYEKYCANVDTDERMTMGEFKKAVHEYDDEKFEYTPLAKQYGPLVYSDTKSICMVDPSGGPYISANMDMKYISEEFKGRVVSSFVPVETGYLIQTYGKFDHLQDRDIIGGII